MVFSGLHGVNWTFSMLAGDPVFPFALDLATLLINGACLAVLLGLLLLLAARQEHLRALAWWGAAYLLGGFSVAVWSLEKLFSPPLPYGAVNALLFLACGMIWSAARIFHGRAVLWGAMAAGAAIWLGACALTGLGQSAQNRIVISSIIVSAYAFLTAAELWRERRKSVLQRRWAVFVPALHGCVFLAPISLASFLPAEGHTTGLTSVWAAVFALETILYVVGTAFIILVLAKEHSLRRERNAAWTDQLTGVLNRRGFFTAAQRLMAEQVKKGEPVSVLMFDIDSFKSINDRFGHLIGDDALKLFAELTSNNIRASDIFARFGGEEFVAMLPCTLADAASAAERIRKAFAAAGDIVKGYPLNATVSVGGAAAVAVTNIDALLAAADQALYRAKANGRNRVECIATQSPILPVPLHSAENHHGMDAGLRKDGQHRLLPARGRFLSWARS